MAEITTPLLLESPAKVNLRLEILRKREDGYHEIRTIFQKINLHDRLYFSLKKRRGIQIRTDHPALPTGKKNLVHRAISFIMGKSDFKGGVDVLIEKRIPLGAGLGGGSSNAAATLRGLNQLLNMDLSTKELMEMGVQLGADVPFFLFKGAAIGSGIGERLRKITLPRLWYILIYPNFEVSTGWAYQNYMLNRSKRANLTFKEEFKEDCSGLALSSSVSLNVMSISGGRLKDLRQEVKGLTKTKYHINLQELLKSAKGISALLYNDLERVVSSRFPEISLMREMLLGAGAEGALMTGSGPTVFGLFPEEQRAIEAFHQLKRRVRGKGWKIFQAHSIP